MRRLFSTDKLKTYATAGHTQVHGWLSQVGVDMLVAVGEIQDEQGAPGHVCEIGVHHGRFFLLLYLMLREGERALAVDLFSKQEENVDGSGKGDLEKFLENVDRHAGAREGLDTLEANSMQLNASDLAARLPGGTRLFSVDGGHTADITVNDLALAEAMLSPQGVLVLDDYFNQAWPGVSEGLNRYMLFRTSNLRPFATGGNKLLFAHKDVAEDYRVRLEERIFDHLIKRTVFYGQTASVYVAPTDPALKWKQV